MSKYFIFQQPIDLYVRSSENIKFKKDIEVMESLKFMLEENLIVDDSSWGPEKFTLDLYYPLKLK
jgi:hypothetical protein